MSLIIIASVSKNDFIGYQGGVPWYIPEDLKRFRELTLDHPVIMGRRTYESILEKQGRPLVRRINIVLSREKINKRRVLSAANLEDALYKANKFGKDVYVIGGTKVYQEFLPLSDKIELTRVYKNVKGNALFPKINWSEWKRIFEENHQKFSFETYERK